VVEISETSCRNYNEMVVGIQEINPTIKYVKGEHNVVADGLSIIGAVRRCEKIY